MSSKKNMKLMGISGFITLILVLLDQFTKFLAVSNLKNNNAFELIDGVFEFRYLENQSAAFGIDIVGSFVNNTVAVEGANGYTATDYKIYQYTPAAALGANTYEVTIG